MNVIGSVLVLLEWSGEECQMINAGLVSEGRRLAHAMGVPAGAVVIGTAAESAETYRQLGASTVYLLKSAALATYRCEVFAYALTVFARLSAPRLLLMAHSDRGHELAPRVAFCLDTAAVTGCVDITVKNGDLSYVRPLHGFQFVEEVSFAPSLIEIATMLTEALDRRMAPESAAPELIDVPIEIPSAIAVTEHRGLIPPDFRTLDIGFAKRIVATGAGSTDPELLGLVHELASLLQGSVGATRPVVDDGCIPKERMIGQTGKTVAPELYLAVGISGSPHHVAGIQESGRILAINRDVRAPIFQFSDIGFIGDLKKILPALVERIRAWRDAGG